MLSFFCYKGSIKIQQRKCLKLIHLTLYGYFVTDKNPNTPSTISHMSISPMPVTIPGNFYFSADMKLTRPVGESSMEISIKRKMYWVDIPIPCIFRVGSW